MSRTVDLFQDPFRHADGGGLVYTPDRALRLRPLCYHSGVARIYT